MKRKANSLMRSKNSIIGCQAVVLLQEPIFIFGVEVAQDPYAYLQL